MWYGRYSIGKFSKRLACVFETDIKRFENCQQQFCGNLEVCLPPESL